MKPSAKFSLRLCATLGAALLAGCAKAKDTRTEAATAPAADASTQDTLAAQNAAAEPAPASEPTLREIIAAYHNDAPYQEATFIRDLELEDGSIVLLVTRDGAPELLLQSYAKAKANTLLADRESKLGVSWKDYPAGWDDFPEHHYEKRFIPVNDKSSGKWTYIDICHGGSPLTPPIFDDVHPFKEGLGAVQYDRKWGFVDMHGGILIPFDYEWNYPEIRDFDSELYAAGEFPFDYSAYTQAPVDIVHKTAQGLVFSFHALSKEERAPKKNQYATCYRVHISTKDGTELFPGRALYEEYFEDAI